MKKLVGYNHSGNRVIVIGKTEDGRFLCQQFVVVPDLYGKDYLALSSGVEIQSELQGVHEEDLPE